MDFRKIQGGHEPSVRELATSISSWVFGTVMSTLKNTQDAEEVIQDTVLKAIEVIMEDNDTIKSIIAGNVFKPWVFRIAINKAKDKLKFNQQKKRSHLNGTVKYFVFTSNEKEKLNFISWVKFFFKNL